MANRSSTGIRSSSNGQGGHLAVSRTRFLFSFLFCDHFLYALLLHKSLPNHDLHFTSVFFPLTLSEIHIHFTVSSPLIRNFSRNLIATKLSLNLTLLRNSIHPSYSLVTL